jgi:hypothetical protein
LNLTQIPRGVHAFIISPLNIQDAAESNARIFAFVDPE